MDIRKKILLLLSALLALSFTSCRTTPKPPNPEDTLPGRGNFSSDSIDYVSKNEQDRIAHEEAMRIRDLDGDMMGDGLTGRDMSFMGSNGEDAGIRGQYESVYFDFDQSFVRESERSKVSSVADYLDQNSGSRLIVEGHCDWKGTSEYNMALGDRRANSVKQYLGTLGVSSSRIEIRSMGDQNAIDGASPEQSANDRRAEFVLIPSS
tara:strand:- start:158 stop:778 length:621 start_codon:yes stop_codon:yes gene_type:complete